MRSSFAGFEIARTALTAAQNGLDITGQNIANIKSEGYTRQTIKQSAIYFGGAGDKYANTNLYSTAQGVKLDEIAQVRDQFLDKRLRTATATSSEFDKLHTIMTDIENVFDETTNDGLGVVVNELYARLQNLAYNTGDVEFAGLVRASAQKVTETLNYYSNQLQTIQDQEYFDLNVIVIDMNAISEKINAINKSIQVEKMHNSNINPLLDQRNVYLDQLAQYVDIDVVEHIDGTVSVSSGSSVFVDGTTGTHYQTVLTREADGTATLKVDGTDIDNSSGSVRAYLDMINGNGVYATGDENTHNGIPFYKESMDLFSQKFLEVFNNLNGDVPLFKGTNSGDISISDEWLADPGVIKASNDADPKNGSNDNILRMIQALDAQTQITPTFKGSFDTYVLSLMSDIAIETGYLQDMTVSSGSIVQNLAMMRESVSGVSLNEESVNLMTYQRAFEAASRFATVMDSMLDTLINGMGLVGR